MRPLCSDTASSYRISAAAYITTVLLLLASSRSRKFIASVTPQLTLLFLPPPSSGLAEQLADLDKDDPLAGLPGSRHFSYVALEGGKGAVRCVRACVRGATRIMS